MFVGCLRRLNLCSFSVYSAIVFVSSYQLCSWYNGHLTCCLYADNHCKFDSCYIRCSCCSCSRSLTLLLFCAYYAVQHGIPIICFVLFILGLLDSCLFGLLKFGLLTNASIHSKLRCYPITVGFCSQRHNID